VNKTIRAESQQKLNSAKGSHADITQQPGAVKLYVNGRSAASAMTLRWFSPRRRGLFGEDGFPDRVPRNIDLTLKTVNSGHIQVGDISGEYSIHNVNGTIDMTEFGLRRRSQRDGHVRITFKENPERTPISHPVNAPRALFPHNLRVIFASDVQRRRLHRFRSPGSRSVRPGATRRQQAGISRGSLYGRTHRGAADSRSKLSMRHTHSGEDHEQITRQLKIDSIFRAHSAVPALVRHDRRERAGKALSNGDDYYCGIACRRSSERAPRIGSCESRSVKGYTEA